MRGITLMNYNFKGGVGKTTLTGMEGYLLARDRNINKVLLIDFDPQANLSAMMKETFHIDKNDHSNSTFYKGLANRDLSNSILKLSNKLDLVEANIELNDWVEKVSNLNEETKFNILKESIKPIKNNYDYILVDVPPTFNNIVRNAIMACDGVSIVLQTQKMSYNSALVSIDKMFEMRTKYKASFTFIGIVLYLRKKARIDNGIVKSAEEMFGDTLYSNMINYQERVNTFTAEGISDGEYWDKRAIGMYQRLTDELKEKVQEMIING